MKVSIAAAGSISLNHMRVNRMPIFEKFPKAAFAKFFEVCFLFSKNDEFENFKSHLKVATGHTCCESVLLNKQLLLTLSIYSFFLLC